MTFKKENIESLKLNCQQIIQLLDENVDGALMHSQLMALGERLKDFGKNPIVKNSGILFLNEHPISSIDVDLEPTICRDDVLKVAKSIGVNELSESVIHEIIDEYAFEQKRDTSATWNLVVENQILNKLGIN